MLTPIVIAIRPTGRPGELAQAVYTVLRGRGTSIEFARWQAAMVARDARLERAHHVHEVGGHDAF